jgi:hypothetical protein
MRPGTQNIMLTLRFNDGDEEVNRQVVAVLQRDETNETVLDVICAFAILSASQWPGSAKFYRLFVRVYAELWSNFLETLPAVERAEFALDALRGMGAPLPEAAGRVAGLAQRELERRGIPAPIQ